MDIEHLLKPITAIGKLRLFKKRTPLRVIHTITYKCNLRCKFCEIWAEKVKQEMNTKAIKKAMNEFHEMGTISWGISGGEPFLRKDLVEILKHGKELNFINSVVSNGIIVENRLDKARRYIDLLNISLEGRRETNDKIRGKGTYEKAVTTIKKASELGIRTCINTAITSENLNEFKYIIDLAEDLNVLCSFQPVYELAPYHSKPRLIRGASKLKVEEQKYLEIIEYLIKMKKMKKPILCSSAYLKHLKDHAEKNKNIECLAGKLYCIITPDGALKICPFDKRSSIEGNWKKKFYSLPEPTPKCVCLNNCYVEYNLLFSMNIDSILNALNMIR